MNDKLMKFLQTNRLKAMELAGVVPALDLRVNELSQNETWSILDDALGDALGVASYNFFIEDIYEGTVIYQLYADYYDGDPTLYRRAYSIDESTLQVTFEQPEEVIRRVSYETKVESVVANAAAPEEPGEEPEEPAATEGGDPVEPASDSAVAREQDTQTPGGEDDVTPPEDAASEAEAADSEAAPPPESQPTANAQPCGCQDTTPGGTTVNQKTDPKKPAAPKANADKPQTLEAYIAGIPDAGARAFIANGVKKQAARRVELIDGLKANEACLFAEDDLKVMSDDQLERLNEMVMPADYGGRTPPRANAQDADEEVLELPSTYAQPASA